MPEASTSPSCGYAPPHRPDATLISELAFRSKAHWGYDAQFMAACRDGLTVRSDECDGTRVVLAGHGGHIVGYYQLAGEPPTGEPADLHVEVRRVAAARLASRQREPVARSALT